MKTGIIGLPQVGKTSLFKILTKAKVETPAYSNPREAHLGVAKVPDDRLDKLADDFVDDAEFFKIRGHDLHGDGGGFRLCGIAPDDGCATFR